MRQPPPHPNMETLAAFRQGNLSATESEVVKQHLSGCEACSAQVTRVAVKNASNRMDDEIETIHPDLLNLADHRIVRELGRGGMGVVYLAHNELMGRAEVLKVVSRHLLDRKGVLDRFMQEIRSASRLQHANVVSAYSAFRSGESIVFAMEYVDGPDLSQLVKSRGQLPVPHACFYVYQAALGLEHAHEAGMVHRDIKPGNLILTRKGDKAIVKILDFGLAKATREEPIDGGLTHQGQMLGTPDYIAPEQSLDAQKSDIRADIYSLGCTLYYLLTGHAPFQGTSLYDILQAHHSMDAPLLNLQRPDVPSELGALVAKMMAKQPDERFQTPIAVAKALLPFFKAGATTLAIAKGAANTAAVRSALSPGSDSGVPVTSASAFTVKKTESTLLEGPKAQSKIEGPVEHQALASSLKKTSFKPLSLVAPLGAFGAVVVVGLWASGMIGPRTPAIPNAPANRPSPATTALAPPPLKQETVASKRLDLLPIANDNVPVVVEKKPQLAMLDEAKPQMPAEVSQPAPVPVPVAVQQSEKIKNGPIDLRLITLRAGQPQLAEAGERAPLGPFFPYFLLKDLTGWQIADPDAIKLTARGIVLTAGANGNFLLTKKPGHEACKLSIAVAASEGTEAFLVLHANQGPQGWSGITSRIVEENKKVRAGLLSAAFQLLETGARPQDVKNRVVIPVGKSFRIVLIVDKNGRTNVQLNGKPTASFDLNTVEPALTKPGVGGVFLKSGTLTIESLTIED